MDRESSPKEIMIPFPESPGHSNHKSSNGNQIADFLLDLNNPGDGSPGLPGSMRTSMGQPQPPIYNIDKETEISADDFRAKQRHLIIMTSAGKPVYSRYGDEAELSPVVATLNVVVNKLSSIRGQSRRTDVSRIETSTNKTIVVVKHGLIAAVITKDKSDSDNVLKCLASVVIDQVVLTDFR